MPTPRAVPGRSAPGLSLYSLLGGLKRSARFQNLPRAQWDGLDGLDTRRLQNVFRYWDGQTDDAALTRAVWDSAQALGAELACPATFLNAERVADGFQVRYAVAGQAAACRAAALVNAAGPWANEVLASITPLPPPLAVELVQGVHAVFAGALARGVYYVESPCDRRAVFVMPWQGNILVGTTEQGYRGEPDEAQVTSAEIDYLRETFQHYFPGRPADVLASFCGLRVLPAAAQSMFHRSRETLLSADAGTPALVTVVGGKLAGYRVTAARVVNMLKPALPERAARADTAKLILKA